VKFARPGPGGQCLPFTDDGLAKNCLGVEANMTVNSRMETSEQLRELSRTQKALNERIGMHTDDMSEADKTKWILNFRPAAYPL
jgi:hypothetical protein